jgi:hypothetical protein
MMFEPTTLRLTGGEHTMEYPELDESVDESRESEKGKQ